MSTLTVPLTASMEEFVEARASAEGFKNAGEYVRALIERAQQNCVRERIDASIRAEIEEDAGAEFRPVNTGSKISVAERMSDSEGMAKAMGEAIREAVREHKLLGYPIVVWKDGKVVWIPPEEIELADDKPNSPPTLTQQ